MTATGPAARLPWLPQKVRRALPLVFIGALVLVAVLTARPRQGPLPLDPDSTAASGTKALALILAENGAEVEVLSAAPTEELDTMLVLVDNVDAGTADDLRRFARDGGVLVVTGGGGALAPDLQLGRPGGIGLGDLALPRRCDIQALKDVDEVDVGVAPMFDVPQGATGCYRDDDLAWLVVQSEGAGTIVVTGGPEWLTNRDIRVADHAVLATALLAPRPGTRVGILRPDFNPVAAGGTGAGGTETLTDLIPPSVRLALLQLGVAFFLVVLWRARRLGKPMREPQAVRLPGSDLVVAVGHLLQRSGARGRAAAVLRAELLGVLTRRFGAGAGDDAGGLTAAVSAHTGTDPAEILDVLDGPEPSDDRALVLLARRTESLRHAVMAPTGETRVDNAG